MAKIEVSDRDIPTLISFFKQEYIARRTELVELHQRLEEIKRIIAQLEAQASHQPQENEEEVQYRFTNRIRNVYNSDWTWLEKIKYVLNLESTPLSTRDIIERLIKLEPELSEARQKLTNSVPATISVAVGRNELMRLPQEEGQEFIYTLPRPDRIRLGNSDQKKAD